MSHVGWRTAKVGAMLLVCSFALFGCASKPKSSDGPVVPIAKAIEDANAAQSSGDQAKAMSILELATRQHPSATEPWLRMAQIQFDAGNYGPAMTHAKEVLQRDVRSDAAQSLIAVSGLRASAAALSALRARAPVQGSTRSEAEVLAFRIRDALREPILVPAPSAGPPASASEAAAPPPRRRPARPAAPVSHAAPARPAPSSIEVPANPSGGDPFRLLKQTP